MYRKYKVTSGCDRVKQQQQQPTAAEVNGKYSQRSSLGAPLQATLVDKDVSNQPKTTSSSLDSSSPVAKQHNVASSSSNEDAVVIATVDAAWKMIDEQSEQEMRRRRRREETMATAAATTTGGGGGGGGGGRGWKTIRVFVSSTFADMHSEREILVKKVFPELREWCEERKFSLVDCDLRWGVPKDSPSRTTICTCLEEIDRCHEDNESLPFFVSILSDRYGWIPGEAEVPEDVKEKYEWVPQTSITHMEILHGAYRFSNPNAIFCLRNSSYVEDLPMDKVGRFVDEEKLNQLQLKVLKQRLISKFQNQFFDYNCRVDGVDMSTGREKVNIVGLESFAEKILAFLKSAINRQYPDQHLASELTASQTEQNAHDASMQMKSELFVGRDAELRAMLDYIKDGRMDPQTLRIIMSTGERRGTTATEEDKTEEKQTEEEEEEMRKKAETLRDDCLSFGVQVEDSRILSVVGQPGIGKSSLLAKLAKTANEEGLSVLYHSVGTTDVSTTSNGIIRRIIDSLTEKSNEHHHHQQQQQQHQQQQQEKKSEEQEEGDQIEAEEGAAVAVGEAENENEKEEEEEEDLSQQLKDALAANAAMEADDQLLLIIIDGLDELIDNDTNQFLAWLPPRFPGRLRCVVSCAVDHHPGIARLKSRDSLFLDLDPLTPEGSASMAEYYLQRFNKRLDSVQMSSLLSHPSSSVPLWLSIACEELRVFGDFATVSSKIRNFPDELNELMKDVIKRLIREDETQAMRKLLSWIQCSKSGLPEKAILSLLGNPAAKEPAPLVTWATVRRHLKPFIRSTGDSQSVRIRMAHTAMNKAVEELLLSADGEEDVGERKSSVKVIDCHSYLADFYEYHCSFVWMTLSELPHHLYHAKLGQRMIDFYRKDERSGSVTGFERSRILNKLRCPWFVHSHFGSSDESSIKFYACHMCSIRGHLLNPNNPMPTKDMCAICGNWSLWKQPTNVAKVCTQHRNMHGLSTMAKCFICGNAIFLNSSLNSVLHLCNYCHITGSTMMKCCHLEK